MPPHSRSGLHDTTPSESDTIVSSLTRHYLQRPPDIWRTGANQETSSAPVKGTKHIFFRNKTHLQGTGFAAGGSDACKNPEGGGVIEKEKKKSENEKKTGVVDFRSFEVLFSSPVVSWTAACVRGHGLDR